MMFYASANRDESVFEDPYTFNVDRKPNRHLGFGHGEHFCMGAHFARRSQIAIIVAAGVQLTLHLKLQGVAQAQALSRLEESKKSKRPIPRGG